jgi:hypothetical protein
VASPTPGATHSASLDGVVALGAKNVWAVGEYRGSQNSQRPLVEHWDGRRWKVVSAPGSGSLDAVSAASAKDVWAVGTVFTTGAQGFTEHWDGTSWKSVPMPDQPAAGGLAGVAAVSAHDAWAVGTFEPAP